MTGRYSGSQYAAYAGLGWPFENGRPLANPPSPDAEAWGNNGSYSGYCIVLATRGCFQLRYSAQLTLYAAVAGETKESRLGGWVM